MESVVEPSTRISDAACASMMAGAPMAMTRRYSSVWMARTASGPASSNCPNGASHRWKSPDSLPYQDAENKVHFGGWQALSDASDEEIARIIAGTNGWMKVFLTSLSLMDNRDMWPHASSEHVWVARCGEDAYLWFNDL